MEIETQGEVAVLRMNAGRANAMGPAWVAAFNAQLDALAASSAGALVLTGHEAIFSAGLDIPSLLALDAAGMRDFIGAWGRSMLRTFELERPVVAAVNGHAIAGGCVLALMADWRVLADRDLKIGLNEVPLGIGLPSVVIEPLRAQLPAASLGPVALEGRLWSAHEALELGLVHELAADELARAREKAAALAALPRAAYAQVKRALRAPVAAAVRAAGEADGARWTDTWFSPEGQARLKAAAERLKGKRR